MDPTLFLRPAAPADEAAVTVLLQASYGTLLRPDYAPEVLEAALPLITRANPALLTCPTWFVVESGGRLVGCGGVTAVRPGDGGVEDGVGHIRHVATHPDAVRRGIGRMLMAAIEQSAHAAGMRTLDCFSTLSAEPFYRAAGFETIRYIDISLPGGVAFPSVHMMRPLA